jgi:hypothetical protein
MKTTIRALRASLQTHGLGDSIIAFATAVALTATLFSFYIALVTGINNLFFQVESPAFFDTPWVTGGVIFNFVTLGVLWRYLTFLSVLRYIANALCEISTPYRAAWHERRLVSAVSPLVALALVVVLAIGIAIKTGQRRPINHTASTHTSAAPLGMETLPPCVVNIDPVQSN